MTAQQRIFSGIQPTGHMTLGNYLGAIRHWVQMQHDYPSIFGIMNMHAITVPQQPQELRDAIYETAAALLAAGVQPEKALLFVQSAVPQHAELNWLLTCHTPIGWLNRMTQFKDKAGKDKEKASLGLYAYPVLMAADILVYKATHVPVGDDQKQHLELARDIAGAVNRFIGEEYFPLPEPLIMGEATRVMSLRDGTKKMSKSDSSDFSRINLTDDADLIRQKIMKAKSDTEPTIGFDREKRPEASNLLTIYAALDDRTVADVLQQMEGKGFAAFKKDLADLAIAKLAPVTERMRALLNDRAYLDQVLQRGAEAASEIAAPHCRDLQEKLGFWTITSHAPAALAVGF